MSYSLHALDISDSTMRSMNTPKAEQSTFLADKFVFVRKRKDGFVGDQMLNLLG